MTATYSSCRDYCRVEILHSSAWCHDLCSPLLGRKCILCVGQMPRVLARQKIVQLRLSILPGSHGGREQMFTYKIMAASIRLEMHNEHISPLFHRLFRLFFCTRYKTKVRRVNQHLAQWAAQLLMTFSTHWIHSFVVKFHAYFRFGRSHFWERTISTQSLPALQRLNWSHYLRTRTDDISLEPTPEIFCIKQLVARRGKYLLISVFI